MSLREKISNEFNKVYQQAETMGASINVDPSRPRSCARQRNRPNIATDSIEDWYKVNVAIPFIDHIIAELDSQFSQLANTASQLLCLVPSIMCNKTNIDTTELVKLYNNDLPSPELFEQEFSRWKQRFENVECRPDSCASAIKECECERNASALRRLHNFMRTSMTEGRLTSLALMHIHYKHPVNLDKVVDLFAQKHPRRLQFSSVLLDPNS